MYQKIHKKSIANIRDVVNSFNNVFENMNENIALIIETIKLYQIV